MTARNQDAEDVEAWARAPGRNHRPRAWESWPQKAKDDIEIVLRLKDLGESARTRGAMAKRLRIVYGMTLTDVTLDNYCREVLGRESWDTP